MAKEGGSKPARGFLFILSRLAIVVAAVLVVILGFYAAMNTMNIRMVAKDALTLRAQVVLARDSATTDSSLLSRSFTESFLASDPVLNGDTYASYQIANFYQRVEINPPVVWPWQTEVTVRAEDVITDISGKYAGEDADAANIKTPPEWKSGVYELKMIKAGRTWMIDEMKLVEAIEPQASASASASVATVVPSAVVSASAS